MKTGKNERCPCGSGKKYKHCCARAASALRGSVPQRPAATAAFAELTALAKARRYADMEVMAADLLAARPHSGFAWKALGVARLTQNKDALHALERAAELLPEDPEVHSNLGAAWRRMGQLDKAEACYRCALRLRPDLAEVWNNLGNVRRDLGQFDGAIAAFRRAIEIKPEFAKPYNGMGGVFQDLGDFKEAALCHRRALELDAQNVEACTNLGITLRLQSRTSDAETACRRALEIDPDHSAAVMLLAELHSDLGRFQEAEQLYRRASALESGSPEAWAGIAGLKRMTQADAEWLTEAQRILGLGLAPRRELPLRYALGKYFDDVGDYGQAFENFRHANALAQRGRPAHDHRNVAEGIDRLIQQFDEDWMRRLAPRAHCSSERPVFILGMPRSGTTLAEQILAAHPAVFGAGELSFWNDALAPHTTKIAGGLNGEQLAALADDYLRILSELAPNALRVVDKMPGNFLYAGLIHAALPRARFIHLRRDPIDTCLSIYFHNFGAVHTYANDLEDLAHYYAEYLRVVAHWRRIVPPGVILEVEYEELVANPDAVSRRMVQFLGLPWDSRCLDFQRSNRIVATFSRWQVRQAINTQSVARWRHYEEFITPLRALESQTNPAGFAHVGHVAAEGETTAGDVRSAEQLLAHAKASHSSARLVEAEQAYRCVLDADPSNFEATHNLGILALQTARAGLGISVLKCAVALNPRHVHANANLGTAYLVANQLEEALCAYQKTLQLDPGLAGGWRNLGTILQRLGRHDEAADAFQRCCALAPDFDFALGSLFEARRYACNWRDYEHTRTAILTRVKTGVNVDRPFSFLAVTDSAELQLHCATSHVKYLCPRPLPPVWRGERYEHSKIRVAYVSADFRAHVVMELMTPLFQLHDRERFELIGVSLVADDHSDMLARAKRALGHFIDASGLTDADAAQAIRAAEADIVVDLTGYTAGCRAPIFARRPAPVQVSYLGFAGTSGADYFDYLIADSVTVPPTQEPFYSERIVRLRGSFLPTRMPDPDARPTPSRRELGLPARGFIFCAFSNSYKLNPPMFDVWMRLLRDIPSSVLWLRDAGLAVRSHLEREAADRQVDPNRLVFAAKVPAKRDHVVRQCRADLFLDTFPYGAHGTAGDALMAGLPVLTCTGESFASRVAASLLTSLELPELVTGTVSDYATRALQLARDPELLTSLRLRLAERLRERAFYGVAPLGAQLESAYQTMVDRARRGERPVAFSLDIYGGTQMCAVGSSARWRS